ncbi:hypothetical protein Mal52_50380 [Symmachiella dynata]|uniref:AsmA family protein n=1 Tax=Symmachiella dynata TaxID=2527995 RepID=A0A517ZVK9_9PLAN|nr:hypothetical protein [Symmachiella dynata]QDU46517.1 hypothetical protein Mal52_50380 [Symmachiella dynata]
MNEETPKPKRRWLRIGLAVVGVVVLVIACLPTIVANTPLRNTLVNRAIDDPRLQASVGSASFGWTSSASLNQMQVVRDDDRMLVTIDRVLVERSLLGLLLALPDIGGIEIEQPRLEFTLRQGSQELPLDDLADAVKDRDPPESTFVAAVSKAGIVVSTVDADESIVDVDNVTLMLRLRRSESGRELVIDPAVVLDHQALTPELCDRGLHLVAPVLADAATVEGEVSVEIEEFLLPVEQTETDEADDRMRITGSVALHHVRSNLRNPILVEITKLVAGLLNKPPPETIRVLENSRVHFHVAKEGVYHEGMAFVLPDISEELVIRTSGLVGVDRQLDLKIEVALPSQMTVGVPVLEKLTQRPLTLVVHGTLDAPIVGFAEGQDLLDELAGRLNGKNQPLEEPKPIGNSVIELVGGLTEKKDDGVKKIDVESTAKDVINIIRSARDAKKRNKNKNKNKKNK